MKRHIRLISSLLEKYFRSNQDFRLILRPLVSNILTFNHIREEIPFIFDLRFEHVEWYIVRMLDYN